MNLADPASRRRQPELMDRCDLEPDRHRRALRGLARLNAWSGSSRILWRSLHALARSTGGATPLRLLDLATGGGDVPIGLARRAARAGVSLQVAGCDRSATAVEHARSAAGSGPLAPHFFQLDALRGDLPDDDYDVLTCSLFLHHLSEQDAIRLLVRMARAARRLVVVSDLARGRTGYALAWTAARLLTRSEVVHIDGPRSVEGAFTIEEVRDLARRAGLEGARIEPRFPCRWLLSWRRPS